jgi:O-antigen/teichoic acid export membrane protein
MVHFGGFAVGKARFDIALWVSIVWSSLMIVASLAIVFFHQSALLMLIAGLGIQSIVYLYFSRKNPPPNEGGDLKNTKAIIRYGWQMTIVTLPVNLVWYIDKILISHFLGLNQLATFTVSILLPEKVKMLLKQFFPVTFPKQAKGNDSRDRRIRLTKAVLIGTVIFALGIGLYIALCPFFIGFLFPHYNAKEVILISSIAAATLITTPGTLFAQYLEAQGMIRETQIANWGAAGIFTVALFSLIPTLGLVGAILARGIFRFTYVLLAWWLVVRTPIKKESWGGIPLMDIPTAD